MKTGIWLTLALVLCVIGGGLLLSGVFESDPPGIYGPKKILLGSPGKTVQLRLEDPSSGLRSVSIRLLHESGSRRLTEQTWPCDWLGGSLPEGIQSELALELDPALLQIPEGSATLVIAARDCAWTDNFAGNRSQSSIPVEVDTSPPGIKIRSPLTYVFRGGSAVAVYRLSEQAAEDGLMVDDTLYRGFPHPTGGETDRVVLFSIPFEASQKPSVRVFARDAAGNQSEVPLASRVREPPARQTQIAIDEDFIDRVARPLAKSSQLNLSDSVTIFREVNEHLRMRSEATLREEISDSRLETPRWQDGLRQLPGSKVMSRFGERRTYLFNDQPISKARHDGFDLASTSRSKITAAAAGVVIFAGNLGIYGSSIIVDHGLGLSSLYAHLSQLDVELGSEVQTGTLLGRSGSSGLAGGDHLHFAVLVGGTYVDPLEWWDRNWVESHINRRLKSPHS